MILAGVLMTMCAVSLAGMIYVKEHRTVAVSARVVSVVPQYAIPGANPLKEVTDSDVGSAVKEFLEDKAGREDYAEEYVDVKVYAKNAKSSGVQIVFARYGMKVRGIYTAVPGLETLYIRKDGQTYQIDEKAGDEEERRVVGVLVQQEDVRQLFEDVQREYEQALAADAMLRERLADLQDAASE